MEFSNQHAVEVNKFCFHVSFREYHSDKARDVREYITPIFDKDCHTAKAVGAVKDTRLMDNTLLWALQSMRDVRAKDADGKAAPRERIAYLRRKTIARQVDRWAKVISF